MIPMDFETYQKKAGETATYWKNAQTPLESAWYPIMGLVGEAGELANKAKKMLRDKAPLNSEDLIGELGDVLWYVSEIATKNSISLDQIASSNLAKLKSRQERGVLGGSGDKR